jgi:hypothetical protein
MQNVRSHVLTTARYAGERTMLRYREIRRHNAASRQDPAGGVCCHLKIQGVLLYRVPLPLPHTALFSVSLIRDAVTI